MTQEQLIVLAQERFQPGMRVLLPDQIGQYTRRASVGGIVEGVFTIEGYAQRGFGLMVWPEDQWITGSTAYELSWAMKHIQVLGR